MPNTLAHIGAQLPITRLVFSKTDPRWISLGLLIPDLPWILQRVLLKLQMGFQPYDVRAYVVLMSTPVMCALMSALLALLFKDSKRIFWTLFASSLLHLLLDAAQEKGGMGILFLFPFSWESYSWPLFSMDGWLSTALTLLGLLTTVVFMLRTQFYPLLSPICLRVGRVAISMAMSMTYLLLPLLLLSHTIGENVHDTGVISGKMARTGQTIHFDRATFFPGNPAKIRNSTMPEPIPVTGVNESNQVLISGTAVFETEERIHMATYVLHHRYQRFAYTMAGLLAIMLIWIRPVLLRGQK